MLALGINKIGVEVLKQRSGGMWFLTLAASVHRFHLKLKHDGETKSSFKSDATTLSKFANIRAENSTEEKGEAEPS